MARTVIALYDDFAAANAAVRDLTDSGFPRNDISIMASDATGEYSRYMNTTNAEGTNAPSDAASGVGVGAGIGAVIGGLGGLLIGLGALTIPGIGPVITAGPLAAALTGLAGAGAGAVAGGVTGGILGALVDMGVPNDAAQYYAEGIRRGGTLVSVRTDDNMAERARDIMNLHNPVDINERANQWREAGWTGFDTGASSYTGERMQGTAGQDVHDLQVSEGTITMPNPDKPVQESNWQQNDFQTGVGTGQENNPNATTWQDETYQGTNMTPQYGDFNSYDAGFRNHFSTTMAGSGYTYEQYQPAYRYGYDLATNARYRDRDWEQVEPEAAQYWNERNPGTWERIRDAVHYAWQEIKDTVS